MYHLLLVCFTKELWLIQYVKTHRGNTTRAESLEECKVIVISLKDWENYHLIFFPFRSKSLEQVEK